MVGVVGVVAVATGQVVGAHPAIDNVVACVATDLVIERIAGTVDVGGAGQHQIFQVRTQCVGKAGLNRVPPGARSFNDLVIGGVHNVGIVAQTARHRVGAGTTIQTVVVVVARELVGKVVAGALAAVACGVENQVLDVVCKGVGERGVDGIRPLIRVFYELVVGVVDVVHIVAGAAQHGVGSGAAIQHVIRRVPGQDVCRRITDTLKRCDADEFKILDVGGQGIRHGRLNGIGSFARQFHNRVRNVVHQIEVIPGAAD